MHVFLLNLPRLEFAALIPKGDYLTFCMLGRDIDDDLVQSFLNSAEVRQCMPPGWQIPATYCHCSPKINVQGAVQPFADRLVFIGDCGVSRLYKDGIGAAYRTAKAAAVTAVFRAYRSRIFSATLAGLPRSHQRQQRRPGGFCSDPSHSIAALLTAGPLAHDSERAAAGWRLPAHEQGVMGHVYRQCALSGSLSAHSASLFWSQIPRGHRVGILASSPQHQTVGGLYGSQRLGQDLQ